MIDVQTRDAKQSLAISDSDQIIIERKKYAEILIAVSAWIHSLNGIEDNFRELQGSTEKELMEIGSKLADYQSNSSSIAEMSLKTANLLSGDEINNAIAELQDVFQDFNQFLIDSETELDQYIKTVKRILDLIQNVQEPLSGFKKIVKHLRIFGISTKIENSRLVESDTDFSSLADHVCKLSNLINSNYTQINDKSNTIDILLRENFSKLLKLSKDQRSKAQSVLHQSQTNINSLLEKHKISSSSVEDVIKKSEGLYRDIGEIVVSMQYHDITRQQMEHISNVLKDCSNKLIEHFDGIAYEDYDGIKHQLEVIHEVEKIIGLQRNQLIHSKDELLTAVNGILENLNDVKKEVNCLTIDLKNLTEIETNDDNSFFSNIKKGLTSIVKALSEISVLGQELSKTMKILSTNVKAMSSFIQDIETIGSEIELIALNAQVKAAHTGKEGAALGVLAEAIQKLSVEAFEITNNTLIMFKSIIASADELGEKVESETSENKKSEKLKSMIHVCENLINSIQNINENVFTNLSQVEENVLMLSNDIETTVANTNVQSKVSFVFDKIESKLMDIISNCQSYIEHSGISVDQIDMKDLEKLYTMYSERQIHNDFIQGKNTKDDQFIEIMEETEKSSEDNLGDNIELF